MVYYKAILQKSFPQKLSRSMFIRLRIFLLSFLHDHFLAHNFNLTLNECAPNDICFRLVFSLSFHCVNGFLDMNFVCMLVVHDEMIETKDRFWRMFLKMYNKRKFIESERSKWTIISDSITTLEYIFVYICVCVCVSTETI